MISACSMVEDSLKKKSMDVRAERRQRRHDQKKNCGGAGVNGGKRKYTSRALDQESVDQRSYGGKTILSGWKSDGLSDLCVDMEQASKCAECGSEGKKLSRRGPLGPGTLCNACGMRWVSKQKNARNAAKKLQDTFSEGESVEEGDARMYFKRLEDKVKHLKLYNKQLEDKVEDFKDELENLKIELKESDSLLSWQRKLSDQRQKNIKELETQVESLTAKIGEISYPASRGSSLAEAECFRLRGEVRRLEDKNRQLVESMENMDQLWSKNCSAGKEILAQSIEIIGDSKSRSWRSGVVTDGVEKDRRNDEVRGLRKDAEGRSDKPVAGLNAQRFPGGSSEDENPSGNLISYCDSLKAVRYVEQRFINWVNKHLRKPTREEMGYHKTQYPSDGKTCYWAGIPGATILCHYEDACPSLTVPTNEDLRMLFGKILHIEACPMRPDDFVWCLVWQNCKKIEQLPGYQDMDIARLTGYQDTDVAKIKREMRRPGSPVAGDEDSNRSVRHRYA